MKIITGSFMHETNTFSTTPTGLAEYKKQCLVEGASVEQTFQGTRVGLGGFIDEARRLNIDLVHTISADATPGGIVKDEVFEHVWERISRVLDDHPDAQGILLALHGAMVVESYDDGEGALLAHVRDKVGPDFPIIATLDLHAHLTPRMVEMADALIGYKTYPHVDAYERAMEATKMMFHTVKGAIKPVMAMAKPPMIPPIPMQFTGISPAKDFMDRLAALEKRTEILSGSMLEGFPFADIEHMGMGFVVVADNDMDLAQREANALAWEAWNRRHEFVPELLSPAEAVEKALHLSKSGTPIVLPDMSDNPGGGATNDSVAILDEFLKRGIDGVAVATICDPEVAEMAHNAGVGSTIRTNLGGKVDHLHGPSIPIEGKVRSLSDGRYTLKGSMMTGLKRSLGRTAVLEVAGNLIIVGTERQQALDPEIMRSQGLDPRDFRFLVLKSAVHFRSNFTELAYDIVEVTGPGIHSSRLSDFEYHNIRRPLFPLDDDFSWAGFNT